MLKLHLKSLIPACVLVGLAAVQGLTPFLLRDLKELGDISTQIWLRCLLAYGLLLFVPCDSEQKLGRKEYVTVLLRVAIGWVFGLWCYVRACALAGPSVSAFLSSIPSEALWAALILGQRISLATSARLMLCTLGVFAVQSQNGLDTGTVSSLGLLFGLLTGLSSSLSAILSTLHQNAIGAVHVTRLCIGLTSLWFGVVTIWSDALITSSPSRGCIVMLIASSVHLAASSLMWQYVISRFNILTLSNVLCLEGMFTALFSAVFWGEPVAPCVLIGGSLIVLASLQLRFEPVWLWLRRHPNLSQADLI